MKHNNGIKKYHKSASCQKVAHPSNIFYIHFSLIFSSHFTSFFICYCETGKSLNIVCVFFISFIIENYIRLMSSWFLFHLYKYFISIVIHDFSMDYSLFYFKNSSSWHTFFSSYRQIFANKKLLLYLLKYWQPQRLFLSHHQSQ